MEPALTIAGVIAAGAAVVGSETTKLAVKDAYTVLKGLIKKWFDTKKSPNGDMVLAEYEKDPETWEKPFSKAIIETGADKDSDIINAVKVLHAAMNEMPGGQVIMAKYNIQNCEIGLLAGDNTVIHGGVHLGTKK